jgi:hypothetical protein
MLPVIEGEVTPAYDNPCPSLARPGAPTITKVSFCNSWETWKEFLADPSPTINFDFGEYTLTYQIDDAWRNAIIDWKQQIDERHADNCPEGSVCVLRGVARPAEDAADQEQID